MRPFLRRRGRDCGGIEQFGLGDRNEQASAPPRHARQLVRNLGAQVPRKDPYDVRPNLLEAVGVIDGDARPWGKPALLVWVAVDRERQEIRSDAAVVQERVRLARSSVPSDRPALALKVDQCLQDRLLEAGDAVAERRVCRDVGESLAPLDLQEGGDPLARRCHGCVTSVNSERSTVGWKLFDIDHREAVPVENGLHRPERKVREVLVVDRVELVL